jgi:hypothetical protein
LKKNLTEAGFGRSDIERILHQEHFLETDVQDLACIQDQQNNRNWYYSGQVDMPHSS